MQGQYIRISRIIERAIILSTLKIGKFKFRDV